MTELTDYIDACLEECVLGQNTALSGRELWSAEVVDIELLIAACLADREYTKYLQPNMTELNALARKQKSMMRVNGVRPVMRYAKKREKTDVGFRE